MQDSYKVLIVDDDKEIARGLGIRFHGAGYETRMEHDGQAGLQAAREWDPDIIVLDMTMPVMDGMTMLKRLRESAGTKDIPVIVLSARFAEQARCTALDIGALCFIEKPYDAPRLLMTAQAILSGLEFSAGSA